MTLTETLREFKPNVTDSTIKSYVQNLNKIMKKLENSDYKILENFEKVDKAIENLSPLKSWQTTQRLPKPGLTKYFSLFPSKNLLFR